MIAEKDKELRQIFEEGKHLTLVNIHVISIPPVDFSFFFSSSSSHFIVARSRFIFNFQVSKCRSWKVKGNDKCFNQKIKNYCHSWLLFYIFDINFGRFYELLSNSHSRVNIQQAELLISNTEMTLQWRHRWSCFFSHLPCESLWWATSFPLFSYFPMFWKHWGGGLGGKKKTTKHWRQLHFVYLSSEFRKFSFTFYGLTRWR